ncbi:hypothetical protein [Vibrio brasiliensis]|uniref:hypothetical protein n=1 Tax=Vibrio brasiliensis TaxID=170652 RepID=UPI001EFE93E7|nr:hypothetical protein [Vibrio brasiliensis]MCG9728211.1 hypothetical protein [Vibrio brasiliensis]
MTTNELYGHINALLGLSVGNPSTQGRFLHIQFDGSSNQEVVGIVDALKQGNNPCLSNEDIETDAQGNIESIHVVTTRLRVFQTFRALFNSYFSLVIEGQLQSDKQNYILLDRSFSNRDLYSEFVSLQRWLNLFKSLTKNFIYQNSNSEIKFYLFEELESEKKVKTHELVIKSSDTYDNFRDIVPFPNGAFEFPEDDAYTVEKTLICKSALIKTVKSIKSKSETDQELLRVMKNPSEFIENYDTGYEFYTKKYSIDKFTRDLEVSKIEYFEKINAIIHDNQAKALAIPVVILGTSLLRSWNLMSAILILTAMLLALYLVVLNLDHKISAIQDCVKSADKALNFLKENTSTSNNLSESTSMASSVLDEIKAKGDTAEDLLKNIRLGTFLGAFVWVVYMVCFYLNSAGKCPLS